MDLRTITFSMFVALAAIYVALIRQIPSRLQAEEAPKSAFGFVRVDKFSVHDEHASAHGIDIIFVHGLGSNPDTTWGPKDSNWVSQFLPKDIPEAFHKDIRIFFYNYDSYWKRDSVQTRLRSLGESLLGDINAGIRRTEDECTRSLVFVGHSYGGLVIKQALIQASASVTDFTQAVFFLGTPHRGSSFSVFGSIAARLLQPLGSNPLLLQELVPDSYYLLDLQKDFERTTRKTLRVVNFFEQRPTRHNILRVIQWKQFCVKEQSATYGKENFGLSVDHYGLNKYTSREDGNYKRILGTLLETIKPIALQKQHRLYSVPVTVVESFVERNSLSAAIEKKLRVHHHGASVPHAVAIYGLGGAGKTQLARKYIEDHKYDYNPILWIDARDEESVRSSFERCAVELQLSVDRGIAPTSKLVDSPVVRTVLRWLRNRKKTDDKWLVVIDNADDDKIGIQSVIPEGNQGSIIITSQNSNLCKRMKGYEDVEVGIMEPLEAKTLLLEHLKLEFHVDTKDVLEDCDKIARELGYLALAIDLAGAYIGNDKDPIRALRRYLMDYKNHRDYLLQDDRFCDLSASDKTVWTVWDRTLERIEQRHAHLRPGLLLALLARFRGGVVQDEVFRLASLSISTVAQRMYGNTKELPTWLNNILKSNENGWDDFFYRQGCDVLIQYSLLQRTLGRWESVRMHGLVQWRAKKYEEEKPWETWLLMTVLAGCVQLSKEAKSDFRRELVTHVPAVEEEYLDGLDVKDEGKEFVWYIFGAVYHHEGRWKEAEELEVQVMEMSKKVLGDEHLSTLTYVANLASTHIHQGRWKEAEELLVQVTEATLRVLGNKHPSTITSMGNLASAYRHQGRWKEAEELEVQVLEMRRMVLGDEHPNTLTSIHNLASTYIYQGRWKEAEELSVQVTETTLRVLGNEHPSTITSMGNLASVYRYQGRWKEAEELDVQVMEASKRVLGDEHPDTLTSMGNLASTYRHQGRWKEAEELFVQALETRRRVLGEVHLSTLNNMGNLALTYGHQGRWEEAEELEVQVMETSKRVLGDEHPSTLTYVASLASTYKHQGRWKEAEALFVQALETKRRVLGEEHPDTLSTMNSLAFTLKGQGFTKRAISLMENYCNLGLVVLGPQHPYIIASREILVRWKLEAVQQDD